MTFSAAILAFLLQEPLRFEFPETFDRSGPTPYQGWSQVVDALHPDYNKARHYRWAEDRRVTLNDEENTVIVGPILRENEEKIVVNTPRGPEEILRASIAKNEEDLTRRPRSLPHAASVRCYRGAAAFRSDRGFIGGALHPMPVHPDYTYRLSAYVKFVRTERNRATIALRWLDMTGAPIHNDSQVVVPPLTLTVSRVISTSRNLR